jgi:caffeoyl-CoA O-methyltransferase
MTDRFLTMTDELHRYVVDHSQPLSDVEADLFAETAELGPISMMQISADQGAFLTALTRATGARFAVEVGTFTGYSALRIAAGLVSGGRLLCCDVSEEWTAIAQKYWGLAGVDDRIELRLAPAIDTLNSLPMDAAIDFAFIDADKPGYEAYYEALVPRMRPGGVIAVDNTLWGGAVVDPAVDDADTAALRAFNEHALADPRTLTAIVATGDGVTLNVVL